MITIFKYPTNTDFINNENNLLQLENYVAYSEDNELLHFKPNGIIITTNNTGTTIQKRIDNEGGYETITLENGKNIFTDWLYGFYFDKNIKQYQISSIDVSKYNTSNVTNMNYMFSDCRGLTSLDLSNFDTAKVTDMSSMFYYCDGLTSLDVRNFDTSNVTNMNQLFGGCRILTSLDVSSFNTNKVTDMGNMFSSCSALKTLDLSSFNTSNVTDMSGMFDGCRNLTSLDLSSFNTSNVTNKDFMFNGCNKLTHIKCKQAFKEWCWTRQGNIVLPTAMRNGGNGTWEIVDTTE